MKKAAAVAFEEIADKRLLLPAALAVGCFPVALASLRGGIPADARDASAVILALLAGATLAVVLGARSTAGDLISGRSAFHLARPLTPFEIWFGKLAGSLAVVFGAAALVLLPTAVAGGRFGAWRLVPTTRTLDAILPASIGSAALALAAGAGLAVLFLVSQAIGVAALARSSVLAADAALAGAALLAVIRTSALLRAGGAFLPLDLGGLALGGLAAAALAVGCYRAVTEGTDARRAAARLSRAFWSIVAGAVVLFVLFGAWVLHPAPSDLRRVDWIAPAPSGDWIAVGGPARGHRSVFLDDLRTGEFLRLPSSSSAMPVLSADGRAAAWSTSTPGVPEPSITPHTLRLADPRHSAAWESKDLRAEPLLVLSPDARRLAVISPHRVVVWDAVGGGMVAAATVSRPLWGVARGATCATFAGNGRLRIYVVRPSDAPAGGVSLDILDFDLLGKILRPSGSAGPFRRTFPILASPDRSRLLVREASDTVHLLDGATGRRLAIFSGGAAFRAAAFLRDGRIALFESAASAGRLRILSPDGAGEAVVPVGAAARAWLLGEPRPGAVMLAAFGPFPGGVGSGGILVADLGSGKIERWADDLLPAAPYAASLSGDPGAAPAPGSLAVRLFFTPDRALVALDGPGRVRRLFPER